MKTEGSAAEGSGSSTAGVNGPGETLARVTYLPGVIPPSAGPPSQGGPYDEESFDSDSFEGDSSGREPSDAGPESAGERSARAANVSMHALTRRGMSSAEMTTLLRSRELETPDVEFEVQRLEGVGLLDDHELASNLVRTLHDRKGLGRSAIMAELRRRRIDATAIEEALGVLDGDDELQRARQIADKRAPQLRSLDPETARRRLGAFLMRKGYSGSVVASAVASALSSHAPSTRGPRFQ